MEHFGATAGSQRTVCSAFIRARHHDIIACWEHRVRALPIARKLDRPTLLDKIPQVLNMIADTCESLIAGGREHLHEDVLETHAIERLEADFDLPALVIELGILRRSIIEIMEDASQSVNGTELRALDESIDLAVVSTIQKYARERERTLNTLDRIANAALESQSLDDLVHRLLRILVEASESIDNATLLIPEDGVLRVRATVGLDESTPFTVSIGSGFAGTIAATRKPLELRDAAHDPSVERKTLRDAGVRALYGIPLIASDQVIAVIHMGSLTVNEFSKDDKRLFRAVAGRATEAVYQQILREVAEKSAATLRKREQELRALADNIPQFAWMTDEHGNLYWFNQRWLDYTGTTFEEMSGANAAAYIHPDHVERVMDQFARAIASGEPWEDTFPMRRKDGLYRWFLSRAIPIRNEHGIIERWFGTNTDVTEQRFLDEATKLLNSSLSYAQTLEAISHLAVPELADWCVVDLVDGEDLHRVAIANPDQTQIQKARERTRLFGTKRNDAMSISKVIRTGRAELITDIDDQKLAKEARSPEHLEALTSLGLKSLIIAPLRARGRTLGAITLATSTQDRRFDERDLGVAIELGFRAGIAVDNARLYMESQQALDERSMAVRARDEVLAIVTHDLRAPLQVISMSVEHALEATEIDAKKSLDLIERSVERMAHMIDELLDMATVQASGLTLTRRPESVDRMLTDIIEAHDETAASAGLQLVLECERPSLQIWCDRERLERVFGNLIGNAIKFCKPGDVVVVRCRVEGSDVVFSVADNGPGIPPDQLPHLFEPFWTANRAGKKGTGLGLYIAKGIVEAHGGELRVESQPSRGTEFSFTLPLPADGRTS